MKIILILIVIVLLCLSVPFYFKLMSWYYRNKLNAALNEKEKLNDRQKQLKSKFLSMIKEWLKDELVTEEEIIEVMNDFKKEKEK